MSHEMKLGMLLLACGACWGGRAVEPAQKRTLDSPFPQVAKIAEGIAWPKGQALPIFAPPCDHAGLHRSPGPHCHRL